ncbi:MAG: hypothetical protein VYE73_03800 [Acidobacteriota bacterium]|nr:hypothetical protein [Acidobacteriota bacterium]
MSPLHDLAVYAGITLYSAVLVLGLSRFMAPIQLFAYLNIGFTIVHHGPTWIRVFLDKEVLREHKKQVLLFPPAVVLFVYLTRGQPFIVLFIVYFWDRYHAIMQNYGFLRLYDAKFGGAPSRFPKIDLAALFASAFVLLTFNAGLQSELFHHLSVVGVSAASDPQSVYALRGLAIIIAVPIFAAYAWSIFDDARRRGGYNVPKLTYFASLVGGHLLMNTTSSLLLLSCHEKIYHSTQYVVLVQHYNQNRVKKSEASETTRLFRWIATPSGMPLYLGLLAVYAAVMVVLDPSVLPSRGYLAPQYTYPAVLAGLTHYYYDSFLWRVRRKSVRSRL